MAVTDLLALPRAYIGFQRLVWGKALRRVTADHIRPEPGMRVLDLGCGPADVLHLFPDVRYTGVDYDRRYLEMARATFGHRGTFLLADVTDPLRLPSEEFDLVLAKGLIHHIDDPAAAKLLAMARDALRPGGRLVAIDGCHAEGESRLARLITDLDRGEYIRPVSHYSALVSEVFPDNSITVRHDLLRIPYTMVIAECTR